jgi:hypothetical protein
LPVEAAEAGGPAKELRARARIELATPRFSVRLRRSERGCGWALERKKYPGNGDFCTRPVSLDFARRPSWGDYSPCSRLVPAWLALVVVGALGCGEDERPSESVETPVDAPRLNRPELAVFRSVDQLVKLRADGGGAQVLVGRSAGRGPANRTRPCGVVARREADRVFVDDKNTRVAGPLRGSLMGRVGIEPTTLRLRVSCSAN